MNYSAIQSFGIGDLCVVSACSACVIGLVLVGCTASIDKPVNDPSSSGQCVITTRSPETQAPLPDRQSMNSVENGHGLLTHGLLTHGLDEVKTGYVGEQVFVYKYGPEYAMSYSMGSRFVELRYDSLEDLADALVNSSRSVVWSEEVRNGYQALSNEEIKLIEARIDRTADSVHTP